jgi:hypothetical protein
LTPSTDRLIVLVYSFRMGGGRRVALLLGLGILLGMLGCGGGSDEGTQTTSERLYPLVEGPARGFLVRDGDNAVPTFGHEATNAEREQASRVIEAWMRARAATDWKKDCSYFSRLYIRTLVAEDATKITNGRVKTCPQALAYFGEAASGDYKNMMQGPIDSLRIGRGHGYALYHGRDGHDWSLPVDRENGRWLVSQASPIERER